MNIQIRKDSQYAIYEQIVSQIKELISKGSLKENDPLPSIRLLAKDLKVSVITTKRAYEELEREGFIISVAGKGSFVSGIEGKDIKNFYRDDIIRHLRKIKKLSDDGAITKEEVLSMMNDFLE